MNKLVTVLAVLAMLGVAGISMAGNVWIEIEDWGSPHPGLHAYRVVGMVEGEGLTWDGENLRIDTIAGIALHDGPVHHVWANPAAGNDAMTPEIEDLSGPYWNGRWNRLDTHRLINPTQRTEWGMQPSETNDGSNPAGIDLTGAVGYEEFHGVAGLGEYGQPPTDAISIRYGGIFPHPRWDYILQVVLLENTQTLLDIRLKTNDPAQWRQFFNIPIGVPWVPWDPNGDGIVNDADAEILAAHWQYYAGWIGWEHGDFNGDRKVTDIDAAILATHWQEGVTPEPSMPIALLSMAVVGLFAYGWRRRH